MWLQLSNGSVFNLAVVQSLSFGGRPGGADTEWDLLADLADGRKVALRSRNIANVFALQQSQTETLAQRIDSICESTRDDQATCC